MSTPNNLPNAGRFVQVRQGVPTVTSAGATWRGNSMQPSQVFPTIEGLAFAAKYRGVFNLTTSTRFPRGPRVSGLRGTIDARIVANTGDSTFMSLQPTLTAAPTTLRIGLAITSDEIVGRIRDANNTIQADWTFTGAAFTGGEQVHIQFAWDSVNPINGTSHIKAFVNGQLVPPGDIATDPVAPWVHMKPGYLLLPVDTSDGTTDPEVQNIQVSNQVLI